MENYLYIVDRKFLTDFRNWRKQFKVPNNDVLVKIIKKYEYSKDWYLKSHKLIVQLFGSNADLFVGLLAATSPRNSVRVNVQFALSAYHSVLSKYSLKKRFGLAHRAIMPNIERVIGNQPLSGRKVFNFAKNLSGDYSAVTIDIWINRYFMADKKMSDKEYSFMDYLIRILAKRLKFYPAEVQACLWSASKDKYGNSSYLKNDKDYFYYLSLLQCQLSLFD